MNILFISNAFPFLIFLAAAVKQIDVGYKDTALSQLILSSQCSSHGNLYTTLLLLKIMRSNATKPQTAFSRMTKLTALLKQCEQILNFPNLRETAFSSSCFIEIHHNVRLNPN